MKRDEVKAEESQGSQYVDWDLKFSFILKWLQERAWPLSGCILVLALISVSSYLRREGIPISIASSTVLAILPSVFASILLQIIVISLAVLVPIGIFFVPTKKGGSPLLPRLREDSDLTTRKIMLKYMKRWFIAAFLAGLLWGGVEEIAPEDLRLIAILLVLFAVPWLLSRLITCGGLFNKAIAEDAAKFGCIAYVCLVVQMSITLGAATIATRVASPWVNSSEAKLLIVCIAVLILALLQWVVAKALTDQREDSQSNLSYCLMSVVLALGLAASPVGAILAGSSLQVRAPDGRMCVALSAMSSSKHDAAKSTNSHITNITNVRILMEAHGSYLVRLWKSMTKEITFIPISTVMTIDSCSSGRDKS